MDYSTGYQLAVTPTGRVTARETLDSTAPSTARVPDLLEEKIAQEFAASQSQGLFALAARELASSASPALVFWRDFAARYLTELCHTPETVETPLGPIEPPPPEDLARRQAGVPPMLGAEYVTVETLTDAWRELDEWVRRQIADHEEGLAGFLAERAPLWHQVGRVCFHLAENKRHPQFPFAFLATYVPGLSSSARVRYQPLGKALQEYAGARNKQALVRLLSPVERASRQSPLIRELVDSGDIFHPLAWTPGEAYRFLKEAPLYEASGLLVRMPDWWRKRSRPQVQVVIGQKRQSTLGADSMLDFKASIALGDQKITQREWQELLEADEGLVLLKGQWVEVDRARLEAALDHWKQVELASSDGSLTFIEGMRLLAGAPADLVAENGEGQEAVEWSSVRAGRWLEQALKQLRQPATNGDAPAVPGLHATLRPYQQTGVEWLRLMTSLGLGACLADDMGLGKTIQVIGLLLSLKKAKQKKPTLLVLPASLLGNWKAELNRFSPSLSALFLHPSETDKETLSRLAESPEKSLASTDLVLTTYGMLQRQSWLSDVDWRVIVLDEAQAIKNPSTRQTRAVKRLRADARVAMTGTPVENRLSDLWSLFDFLCPGLLGSAAKFKQFVKVLDSRSDGYRPMRNLVSPYILRRLKTDKSVISDLPDKSEVRAYCGLSKRQAALYEKSVVAMTEALQSLDGIQRRGVVLSYLMRFKQICNHPSQLLGDGEYRPNDSGKYARLAEICEEINSRQEKALVFTQFREMTKPLEQYLSAIFHRPGLVLHGGTAVGKRKTLVDSFQRDDGPPFFVLSLKAGGTGLNLTAASHVIHFDRWWNPAVEEQATDRAFRIGQRRNVLVHKFVCRGTIEERIDQLIEEKRTLADELLGSGGGEKLLTEMTDQQLLELVSLDVNKALA